MGKIIIKNQSEHFSDIEILSAVEVVMNQGRISDNETSYCFMSILHMKNGREVAVSCRKNKCSDTIIVWDYPTK
tara:strand:- start:909 stop:1130 length:222 start_codon:yes stop_codon:yes gene_type:complete